MPIQNPKPIYLTQNPPDLQGELATLDRHNQQLNTLRQQIPEHSDLWGLVLQKLRASWTYHSNAIEGSTLSLGDTIFFLQEGLTVQGKPFKDFLDAQNHAEAIDYLFDVVSQRRPITVGLIKDINALLMQGVSHTPATTPDGKAVKKPLNAGSFKTLPNHVLKPDGTLHRYVEPEQVAIQMQNLVDWVNDNQEKIHPAIIATIAHYNMVRIHPFDDGNGRGARILMNIILLRAGFFPAVIRREDKQAYLLALNQADTGDITPFMTLILMQLKTTLLETIDDLQALL